MKSWGPAVFGPLFFRRILVAAPPVAADSTAVVAYPPTATARRRLGSSARAPPSSRATPARASLTPSMTPNTDAGAPSVEVSKLGNNDVGTSCPASDKKLATPIPVTPGVNHPSVRATEASAEPIYVNLARPAPEAAPVSRCSARSPCTARNEGYGQERRAISARRRRISGASMFSLRKQRTLMRTTETQTSS